MELNRKFFCLRFWAKLVAVFDQKYWIIIFFWLTFLSQKCRNNVEKLSWWQIMRSWCNSEQLGPIWWNDFTTMYLRRLCTQGDCVLKVAICVLKVTVYSMWLCTQGDYVLKVTMYSSLQVTMHSRWLYTQCEYVLKVTVHSRWLCTDGGFVLKVTMNSRWLCTPGDCILKWLCTIGEHPVDFLLTWQSNKIVLCLLLSFIKRQVTVTVQSTVHNCIVRSFTFLLKKSLSFLRSVV